MQPKKAKWLVFVVVALVLLKCGLYLHAFHGNTAINLHTQGSIFCGEIY